MAVTKLVAVTIAGKIDEFEDIVSEYIFNTDIHLENVLTVLEDKKKLQPFDEGGQYEAVLNKTSNILKLAGIKENTSVDGSKMSLSEMNEFIEDINTRVEEVKKRSEEVDKEIMQLKKAHDSIAKIKNLNCDIEKLNNFKFIRYRFGHIPREGYKMLETYLADMDIVFVKTSEDERNVWGFYFMPLSQKERVDEIFASLYFERVEIPNTFEGTPKEISKNIEKQLALLEAEKQGESEKVREILKDSQDTLISVYNVAKKKQEFTEVRKKAAHSKEFFYIVGWMSTRDARDLEKALKKEPGVILFYTEKPENLKEKIKPPTKLKNNIVFKPFEFFVNMYGYPAYNEIDPTPLLAFTYILFFGMMFGDVGQSACLAILGFLVYKKTKMKLANIVGIIGLSGIVFGALYGSVFGNEEIIHGVLPPMENITTLLVGTMAMGAVIIIIGMFLNIINSYKNRNMGKMLFSSNGVAGLVFYVSVLVFALSMLIPTVKVPSAVMIALIVVSLIVIFMCEPLTDLINGKKIPSDPMFYVQQLFELIEVLLSYFSNTISFLRIGAFAIVHVGMMMAVSVLATGGAVKVAVVTILGNILVTVLEGLVVGIQVLRLEYYEMFSRYFTGNGKPFVSLKNK